MRYIASIRVLKQVYIVLTCHVKVKHLSPSGLVPLLTPLTGPLRDYQINDSLAILLHLAESHPELPFWPRDAKLRSIAQSAVAEMHAGFSKIRGFDSNFVAKYTGMFSCILQNSQAMLKVL